MKASPVVFFVLGGLLTAIASAQIEFVGLMTSSDGARFALKEVKADKPSGWLALGESYEGYTLVAHDGQRGILSVEKDGKRVDLPLKQDRVVNAAAPKAAKRKVAQVTVKFEGTANVSEQVVRDGMQLKAGDDYDAVVLDRSIRSLYRSGHFKYVEFKEEKEASGAVNLVVVVTPK